jgi:hypothetical protein
MERLGDRSYDKDIGRRRREARRWAGEAIEVIARDDLTGYWPIAGRMWLAASTGDSDPAAAAVELKDCRDRIKAAAGRIAMTAVEPWFAMLRLSIGHATSTDGTPVAELLTAADTHMYADKRRRRG